jgi:hypothetical protein
MNTKVYSVIWADDEWATLKKDKEIRELFDNNLIEVLEFVPTSEKLKDALEKYKDRVDAVIVDGNFPRNDEEYVDPTDISGLVHTLSIIELFNIKRDIPFFLYTGKKIFLQEVCKNGELEYFTKNKRLIQKGELPVLVSKIIKDVDHIHSVEFMVKKKYQAFLNMAKDVDEQCEEYLYQFLLDDARDTDYNKAIAMFNQLRLILERIQVLCQEAQIVPQEVNSLNIFKYFYSYSTKKYHQGWNGYRAMNGTTYKPVDGIMPVAIAHSLGVLIDITQDGSHKKQDLNLFVSEYVYDAKTPFLFRTCLYLVMDVIRWYNKLSDDLREGEIDPSKLFIVERS